jgi:predicted glycosyltransferase
MSTKSCFTMNQEPPAEREFAPSRLSLHRSPGGGPSTTELAETSIAAKRTLAIVIEKKNIRAAECGSK